MESKKIMINGKEEDIYLDIPDDHIEDNRDLLPKRDLEDTLNLDELKRVFGSDSNEQE